MFVNQLIVIKKGELAFLASGGTSGELSEDKISPFIERNFNIELLLSRKLFMWIEHKFVNLTVIAKEQQPVRLLSGQYYERH